MFESRAVAVVRLLPEASLVTVPLDTRGQIEAEWKLGGKVGIDALQLVFCSSLHTTGPLIITIACRLGLIFLTKSYVDRETVIKHAAENVYMTQFY